MRWTAAVGGVLLLALVVTLAGFRVAADRREVHSSHEAAPKTGRFVRAADVELYVQEDGRWKMALWHSTRLPAPQATSAAGVPAAPGVPASASLPSAAVPPSASLPSPAVPAAASEPRP